MPSGETNVQSANPPSEPKPNASSIIAQFHKPQRKAVKKPRQNQDERGLQENRLGLRELLNGIKLEDSLRKAYRVDVNTPVGDDRRVHRKKHAPVRRPVQQVSDRTPALAPVENDAV